MAADNRRVSAEAILKQVIQLGLETLQGEELLVLVDISPIKKPAVNITCKTRYVNSLRGFKPGQFPEGPWL